MSELPIGEGANAQNARKNGFPWCDTCKQPAVLREGFGILHSTDEHQFGAPALESAYDHTATTHEWSKWLSERWSRW